MTEHERIRFNQLEERRRNEERYRVAIARGLDACKRTKCSACPYYTKYKNFPDCEVALLNDAFNVINKEIHYE